MCSNITYFFMWVLKIQTQVFFHERKMFYTMSNFPLLIYFFDTGFLAQSGLTHVRIVLGFLIHMPLLGTEDYKLQCQPLISCISTPKISILPLSYSPSLNIPFFEKDLFIYMHGCINVHHVCRSPTRSKGCIPSPGPGVSQMTELSCRWYEPNPVLCQEQ